MKSILNILLGQFSSIEKALSLFILIVVFIDDLASAYPEHIYILSTAYYKLCAKYPGDYIIAA